MGPLRRTLPVGAFAAGALLPDAIDKSLYYAHVSSFISCTRTFGHTGLFLAAVAAAAWFLRSRGWAALAVGVATHGLLDSAMDLFSGAPSSALIALAWPFWLTHFASYDFASPLDQLGQIWKPRIMITEAIGLLWLVREYRIRRRSPAAARTARTTLETPAPPRSPRATPPR